MKVVRTRVVEQRVSHTAMGVRSPSSLRKNLADLGIVQLLALGTMSRPLLVVLGLMPRAMFAGVFLIVGWGSIEGNGIVHKALFLMRDPSLTPPEHPLLQVRKRAILQFIAIQLFFFAGIMAVSETLGTSHTRPNLVVRALTNFQTAGIGFPIIITLLIPVRHYWLPRIFSEKELAVLDAPTANSAAVLVSIGGPLQPERGSEEAVEMAKSSAREEEEGTLRRRGGRGLEDEGTV